MIKKCFCSIKDFAKRKPSLFIVIVIAAVVLMFYVTYEALHLTSTPTFCGWCHKDTESGPGAEYYTWEKNVHAYVNVGCIDCHGKPGLIGYGRAKLGGLYDLYGEFAHSQENKMKILTDGATNMEYAAKLVPSQWCGFCHSDEVNKSTRENTVMSFLGIKMRDLDKVVNPEFREENGLVDIYTGKITTGVDPNHSLHMKELDLSCMNCHMGVAHAGEFSNKTKMETCFTCHDTEREKQEKTKMPENDNCIACHQLELDVQEGKFLVDKGIEETPWMMPSLTGECSSCHEDAFTLPTKQGCIDCHDESYAEMYDSFRADYDERKAEITTARLGLYKLLDKMDKDQRAKFNELNYYYGIVESDGSRGIHNTEFIGLVFDKANELAENLQESLGK